MSLTPSNMLELSTLAPDFHLPDVISSKIYSLNNYQDTPLLAMFICNHCPYVKHVEQELSKIGKEYSEQIGIVAICANDAEVYPDDSPDQLKAQAERLDFNFPYLYDESQEVAKAYSAACTPDFFLFNSNHRLVYRGRLDESRPSSDLTVTGKDLRVALDNVLAGKSVSDLQYPSIGCNIKWRAG